MERERDRRLPIRERATPRPVRRGTVGRFQWRRAIRRLDGDPFEAFRNLVKVDVPVRAKSSFSHMAGPTSTGAVVYEHDDSFGEGTFHRHAPGWIVRGDAGAFDAAELRQLPATKQDRDGAGRAAEPVAVRWVQPGAAAGERRRPAAICAIRL